MHTTLAETKSRAHCNQFSFHQECARFVALHCTYHTVFRVASHLWMAIFSKHRHNRHRLGNRCSSDLRFRYSHSYHLYEMTKQNTPCRAVMEFGCTVFGWPSSIGYACCCVISNVFFDCRCQWNCFLCTAEAQYRKRER